MSINKIKAEYICTNPDCKMFGKIQILQIDKDIVYNRFIFIDCPYCNVPMERV